ncbi:hypothetical protein CEXT_559131 [Caerostris extrusa]|uniref:Alpha-carbonic anhydrase domain-containing protein n=1 Tax=Caerostris extrusa TaxID=172846 RepID=A0AAV4VEM2_CAEEX|nr:hypothetical protein CEXT_559131 [Caerostris extrusa]
MINYHCMLLYINFSYLLILYTKENSFTAISSKPLYLFEEAKVNGIITNTGHGVIFRTTGTHHEEILNITGGPLSYNYRFSEIHIHFARTDDKGAEHLISGYQFLQRFLWCSMINETSTIILKVELSLNLYWLKGKSCSDGIIDTRHAAQQKENRSF